MALDTTVRPQATDSKADALDQWASALYRPQFPPAWAVPLAAGTLWDAAGVGAEVGSIAEGSRWYVSVGPGRIRIGRKDWARADRGENREHDRRQKRTTEGANWIADAPTRQACANLRAGGLLPADSLSDPLDPLAPGPARSRITEWTAKSRRNMVDRLSTLDYAGLVLAGRLPAMVTLTLCDEWETVAPTGRAFKALVFAFQRRYRRAWGEQLRGIWKLEFQRRGAPHLHVLMLPPAGTADGLRWRQWFATAWSSIVVDAYRKAGGAGDLDELRRRVYAVHEHRKASADYAEGLRAADPKRVAVYFAGHSLLKDKEYQHIVPAGWQGEGAGPGRFWGYWQLRRADKAVPVTHEQAVQLARVLTRWQRSKKMLGRRRVFRTNTRTGEVTHRREVRRRLTPRLRTAGFLVVNDGPAVALMLAATLRPKEDQQESEYRKRRLALIENRSMHRST